MDKQKENLATENLRLHYGKIIKWLIVALIITNIMHPLINAVLWAQYDVSSETTTETITIDGKDGTANYIGNNGDIVNGENNSNKDNNEKNTP